MKREIDIKKLFEFVENRKTLSLSGAFSSFAKSHGYKSGSVRNFYYKALRDFQKNPDLAREKGIDLSRHEVRQNSHFSSAESDEVLKKVTKFTEQGYSVRRACLELSGGDIKKMVRYQNKIRSMKMPKNVLQMPKRSSLSEGEINSLFLGLVKLIKRCAVEEADKSLTRQIADANEALRRSIVELTTKERELSSLKRSFEVLKNEKLLLKEELGKLRASSVSLYRSKLCKVDKLKSFVKRLESSEEKQSK